MSPVIVGAVAAALLIGLGGGWLLRSRIAPDNRDADWRTRIAARDRDLHDTREELAEVTFALQEAQSAVAQTVAPQSAADELARELARADALAERLRAAEAEIADVRNLEAPAFHNDQPDLLQRIEELEVELAGVASHRCPDPSLHASPDLPAAAEETGRRRDPVPGPYEPPIPDTAGVDPADETDDLTRVAGIGIGLAKVLRTMGIDSFEDLARIDDDTIGRLDELVGGVRDRFDRHDWPVAAGALHAAKVATAS